MAAQTYCALVTIDETGRPQVRTMNPFPPEEDMTVWFATNTRSRKVREMTPRPEGDALLLRPQDRDRLRRAPGPRRPRRATWQEILKRKRAYWDQAFPGLKNLVLIKVVPERLDVLNYKAGTKPDPETWRTPSIELGGSGTPPPKD